MSGRNKNLTLGNKIDKRLGQTCPKGVETILQPLDKIPKGKVHDPKRAILFFNFLTTRADSALSLQISAAQWRIVMQFDMVIKH